MNAVRRWDAAARESMQATRRVRWRGAIGDSEGKADARVLS